MSRLRWRDDSGVGTVLGIGLGAVLLGSGIVISSLVAISVGHQRASVAADLAAVAAAGRGCEAAERVAYAQGAIGITCRIEGVDAIVTVAFPAPASLVRIAQWSGREAPALVSTARAGLAGG